MSLPSKGRSGSSLRVHAQQRAMPTCWSWKRPGKTMIRSSWTGKGLRKARAEGRAKPRAEKPQRRAPYSLSQLWVLPGRNVAADERSVDQSRCESPVVIAPFACPVGRRHSIYLILQRLGRIGVALLAYGYVVAFDSTQTQAIPSRGRDLARRHAVWGEQLAECFATNRMPGKTLLTGHRLRFLRVTTSNPREPAAELVVRRRRVP